MKREEKTPINHPENNELLGFVVQTGLGWQAQTVFGYSMETTIDEASARRIVLEQGLSYLTGVWQYFDKDDHEWFPCILSEVHPHSVRVTRTNVLGYQNPDDSKTTIITKPDETNLVKG